MFVHFSTALGGPRAPRWRPAPPRPRARDHRSAALNPSSEDGFSLIELVVAVAMALVLLGATLTVLTSSQQIQARDTEWALSIQEARAGLARVARDIRQAYSVKAVTSNSIDFEGTFAGIRKEIYYECDVEQTTKLRECVRLSAIPPASLPSLSSGTVVVKNLLNDTSEEPESVFSYSPNTIEPTYVKLKAVLPASGTFKPAEKAYTHHVVLYSGAYIREMNLGG